MSTNVTITPSPDQAEWELVEKTIPFLYGKRNSFSFFICRRKLTIRSRSPKLVWQWKTQRLFYHCAKFKNKKKISCGYGCCSRSSCSSLWSWFYTARLDVHFVRNVHVKVTTTTKKVLVTLVIQGVGGRYTRCERHRTTEHQTYVLTIATALVTLAKITKSGITCRALRVL